MAMVADCVRKGSKALIACVLAALALSWHYRHDEWTCSARIEVGDIRRDGNTFYMRAATVNLSGSPFGDTGFLPLGSIFRINMRGKGDYRFAFSGQVASIKLLYGATKVYEGPPIASYRPGSGPLGLAIEGEGSISIVVADRCSLSALFGGGENR